MCSTLRFILLWCPKPHMWIRISTLRIWALRSTIYPSSACVRVCGRVWTDSAVCVCVAVISETFEEESCNGATSEDDPETQSTCSFSSNSAPLDVPCPYLPSPSSPYPLLSSSCPFPSSSSPSSPTPSPVPCPGDLELPGPGSLEGFSMVSPVLGPRSECSGASSPECDQERGDYHTLPSLKTLCLRGDIIEIEHCCQICWLCWNISFQDQNSTQVRVVKCATETLRPYKQI